MVSLDLSAARRASASHHPPRSAPTARLDLSVTHEMVVAAATCRSPRKRIHRKRPLPAQHYPGDLTLGTGHAGVRARAVDRELDCRALGVESRASTSGRRRGQNVPRWGVATRCDAIAFAQERVARHGAAFSRWCGATPAAACLSPGLQPALEWRRRADRAVLVSPVITDGHRSQSSLRCRNSCAGGRH